MFFADTIFYCFALAESCFYIHGISIDGKAIDVFFIVCHHHTGRLAYWGSGGFCIEALVTRTESLDLFLFYCCFLDLSFFLSILEFHYSCISENTVYPDRLGIESMPLLIHKVCAA